MSAQTLLDLAACATAEAFRAKLEVALTNAASGHAAGALVRALLKALPRFADDVVTVVSKPSGPNIAAPMDKYAEVARAVAAFFASDSQRIAIVSFPTRTLLQTRGITGAAPVKGDEVAAKIAKVEVSSGSAAAGKPSLAPLSQWMTTTYPTSPLYAVVHTLQQWVLFHAPDTQPLDVATAQWLAFLVEEFVLLVDTVPSVDVQLGYLPSLAAPVQDEANTKLLCSIRAWREGFLRMLYGVANVWHDTVLQNVNTDAGTVEALSQAMSVAKTALGPMVTVPTPVPSKPTPEVAKPKSDRRKGRSTGAGACFNCGESGHTRRNCPKSGKASDDAASGKRPRAAVPTPDALSALACPTVGHLPVPAEAIAVALQPAVAAATTTPEPRADVGVPSWTAFLSADQLRDVKRRQLYTSTVTKEESDKWDKMRNVWANRARSFAH